MIALIIVLVIAAIVVIWGIVTYNGLIASRNQVDRAFADMDVYLQKRFQLVPNLLATAQKLTDQEQAIFEKITQARAAIGGARTVDEKFASEDAFSQALRGFISYAEQNPQLVSQQGLSEFATSLNEIDTQIRNSQQFYNGAVLNFQNSAEVFPANIIAGMFKMSTKPFFKAADQEKENVQVQFK
ncbi:MAG: LemA family protein [bacterium]